MEAMNRWGHFDGTTTCPVPKGAAHPMNAESEAIKEWKREDVMVRGLLSPRLPDRIFIRLIDHKTAKGRWEQLIEELGQPAFEDQPELLMDVEEDHSLKVEEDGATRKASRVERDVSPCVELLDPGVSCLATQEDAGSLTLSSSSPPTNPEAAGTQRSPAANTGTPDIPVPDHGANLELQPHDTPPPPNEAAEPPIHQPPKKIRPPTEAGGPMEFLPGEESQRTMCQRSLTSARTLEGNVPIGEAHGQPPDFANPQTQGSTAWEPAFVVPKARVRVHQARRPILDKGACTRPDPWPNLSIVIVDPDTYFGSALQLEGEQTINLQPVGCELHAAPSTPQHFSFSPSPPIPVPLDTLVRENPSCREGAATERRVTEVRRPKPWKPPDPQAEHLQEGGALSALSNVPVILEGPDPLGLVGAVVDVDVREVEPSGVDAHKRGGALPVVGVAPALAEGTAGVEPAGEAETATAAKSEALVPWARYKAGRGRKVEEPPPEALPQKGERSPEVLSCKHEPERPEALPPDGTRERGATPQGNPNKAKCEPDQPPREPSHEAFLSAWEGPGPWDPGGGPARKGIAKSKGPVKAKKTDAAGIVAHKKNPGCEEVKSVCQRHPEEPTTHLCHFSIVPSCRLEVHSLFRFEAHRGAAPSEDVEAERPYKVAVTPASHHRHTHPAPCVHEHWQNKATRGHSCRI